MYQNVQVEAPMMKTELIMFPLPQKLNKVTISGQPLLSILDGAFEVNHTDAVDVLKKLG